MRSRLLLAALLGLAAAPVLAQPAAAPREEPAVRRSVIEDDGARIEELSVRGAVRSTRVKPKGAIRAEYEIVPIEQGRDVSEGPSSAKGNAGQAVWRVLKF